MSLSGSETVGSSWNTPRSFHLSLFHSLPLNLHLSFTLIMIFNGGFLISTSWDYDGDDDDDEQKKICLTIKKDEISFREENTTFFFFAECVKIIRNIFFSYEDVCICLTGVNIFYFHLDLNLIILFS
jgi:hypothetical protein